MYRYLFKSLSSSLFCHITLSTLSVITMLAGLLLGHQVANGKKLALDVFSWCLVGQAGQLSAGHLLSGFSL